LRREVKVKQGGEEEVLETLVKKWTEAGREVAWELWELVKDNTSGDGAARIEGSGKASINKRGFNEGWGWSEKGDEKRVKLEERERNWGWDIAPNASQDGEEQDQENKEIAVSGHTEEEEEEEQRQQETLGTMLRQLGIDPETLGWSEEEGTFVGE